MLRDVRPHPRPAIADRDLRLGREDRDRGRGKPSRPRHGNQGSRPRRQPPRGAPRAEASPYDPVHLPDDLVRDLKVTARPGKGDILVKVFADAVAAYSAGDVDEAIRLGDQAKHIALRCVPIREFLGIAYYSAGRWTEAQRELAAFRRLSGSTEQNPVLADAYRALGKPDKALILADEIDATKVEPAVHYEGEIVAAGALRDMGRADEAIARLQKLDLQPQVAEAHHARAWYVLADLLESKGRFTQARELFDAVAAVDEETTDAGERAARLRAH